MQNLTGKYDLPDFFSALERAVERALLLDFDGTLAPFHPEPDRVAIYPAVRRLLNSLLELGRTRIVLVTGRATKSLVPLLGLRRRPEIWGSHGLERLHADDTYEVAEVDNRANQGLTRATQWIQTRELGHRSEQKPGCLTLNLRGLPPDVAAPLRDAAHRDWDSVASEFGLSLHETDGGVELRVPVRNKGDAVMTVREEMKSGMMAYLGDDLTDEDAFRALDAQALGVLVRPVFRPTAADFWIQPPDDLVHFLEAWLRTDHAR